MHKLEVLIEENDLVRPVEIVADAPVSALVPALVEELRLPLTDESGKKMMYMLRHASTGQVLSEQATLLASGVTQGARLTLDSYAIDGLVAPPMSNIRQGTERDGLFHSADTSADVDAFPVLGRTSAHVPAISNPNKKNALTRRSFLLLGGVALVAGTAGLGYAAYRSVSSTLNMTDMMGAMHPTTSHKTPTTVKPIVPTTAKPSFTFARHSQIVRAVAWSPDGAELASGADDAQLFVWGIDGMVHQTIPHPASVRAVAWSSDGQRLVTGANTQVLFLNVLTGATLGRSTHHHTAPVTSLAWTTHNQQQVVSGGQDNHAVVWNTTTYQAQATFTHHNAPIQAVSWAADGQTVASSSEGGAVRVWSANDVQEVHAFYQDARLPMRTLAFAPNGTLLAVGGDDGMVRFWNAFTCQHAGNECMDMPQRIQVSHTPIRSVAWSLDGRFLAVGCNDGIFSLFYPAQGMKPLFSVTVQKNMPVHSITWSPNGNQLATASGNKVIVWNLS